MKAIKKSFLLSLLLLLSGSAFAQMNAPNYGLQVECLGVEMDGSQTLRSLGTGRNKRDAVEQAKKNAVAAVLFNGIRGGQAGCDMRPLVPEVNAREKYAEYFNIFFADGGEYLNYVSMADRRLHSNQSTTTKLQRSFRITVRVLRSELKARLLADGVLKQ